MLKGVNKSVIEINNTDNEYIEKAILFIKPEKQETNSEALKRKAKRYIKELGEIKVSTKKRGYILPYYIPLFLGSVMGAAICFIFLKIL